MAGMEPSKTRASGWLFLLAAVVVSASALGAMYFTLRQAPPPPDTSGFDIAEVKPEAPAAGPAAPAQPAGPAQDSGLSMLKTGGFPKPAAPRPRTPGRRSPGELAKGMEPQVVKLAQEYTRRYPVIQQYGRDWMSYPDLKKLNDAYMRDHDPVAFMRGVAASPNFATLIKKYAGLPPIQGFVRDAVARTPGDVMTEALGHLNEQGEIKRLVQAVAQALGLPPALFAGGSDLTKIDEKAVMGNIMQGHPELQKALRNDGPPAVALPAGASAPQDLRKKRR